MSNDNQTLSSASIPSIIRNDDGVYEGDLAHYGRAIFFNAQNLGHPYHNFRHMFHVLWLCHGACLFYADELNARQKRNLLIAAMFHDFNHSGMLGDDDLNIEHAVRGLRKHIAPEDAAHVEDIVALIRATEYPYTTPASELGLCELILRDADMSQALSVAWMQQVVFGLADEWDKSPLSVLKMQEPFLKNLAFHTEWAKRAFPQHVINAKIEEARGLLALFEPADA